MNGKQKFFLNPIQADENCRPRTPWASGFVDEVDDGRRGLCELLHVQPGEELSWDSYQLLRKALSGELKFHSPSGDAKSATTSSLDLKQKPGSQPTGG